MSSEPDDANTQHAPRKTPNSSSKLAPRPPKSEDLPPVTLIDPSRIRDYYKKGRYNDAYRELYNEQVETAAARFEPDKNWVYYQRHVGASVWSASEQAALFAALERLGRNDLPGIAAVVGTKSIPEIQEYLLLLHDAAANQGNAKLLLRNIPAALEVSDDCNEHLDLAGLALAGFQETFEAKQEQKKFGDYWLITSDLAENFEKALDPSRLIPSGRGSKGSCKSCQESKRKCDRKVPCGNCVKRNFVVCEYKDFPVQPKQSSKTVNVDLPQAIPEANLLRADVMLTLSRDVFMNRSPTVPSPWAHWSEYISEFASEPAIYRTAFNDLHALVVSITKRLTYTAMVQATSRHRSQRRRKDKELELAVKARDVFAAIDILGMKRNGRKRWRSVAQRCALTPFIGDKDSFGRKNGDGKSTRLVSLKEVENYLRDGLYPLLDPPTSDVEEVSPPTRGSLPDSDADLSSVHDADDIGAHSEDEVGSADATSAPATLYLRHTPLLGYMTRRRDGQSGRFLPDSDLTLEGFDQEASQKEEQALWEMLRIAPPARKKRLRHIEDDEGTSRDEERIVTEADDWRVWTDYKSEREAFKHPIREIAASSATSHASNTNIHRASKKRRHERELFNDVELEAHETASNAVLRSERFISNEQSQASNSSESDSESSMSANENAEDDAPNQPLEYDQISNPLNSESDMDWE